MCLFRKPNILMNFVLILVLVCLGIGQAAPAFHEEAGDTIPPSTQPIIVDTVETVKVYVEGGALYFDWDNVFPRIMMGEDVSDEENIVGEGVEGLHVDAKEELPDDAKDVEEDVEDVKDDSEGERRPFHLLAIVTSVESGKRTDRPMLRVNYVGDVTYETYSLKDPYRVVLDIKGAMITEGIPTIEVNDGIVQRIRVSQNTRDTVRVVADLEKPVGYKVSSSVVAGIFGLDVLFNHHISDVYFEETGTGGRLNIISSGELEYTSMPLFDPARIVLDARPATLEQPLTLEEGVGEWIKSVRASQYDVDTVRFVIDLMNPVAYRVQGMPWTSWKLSVDLADIASSVYYVSEPEKTKVSIPLVDNMTHTARYFSNPDRIVVDLPGLVIGTGENILPVNDGIVEKVRIGQFEPQTARVVIDLSNRSSYDIKENNDRTGLIVEVFKPTLLGKSIVIDPGHGGAAPGAVGPSGVMEKTVNLDIALRLNRLLVEAGAHTIMTRIDDSYVFLPDRSQIANANNVDIFVSIHANSAKKDYASGTETFYYPGSVQSKALAESIQSSLVARIGLENRGAKAEDFLVLRLSKMPAVLVEVAFLSNEREERLLAEPSFRQAAAEAICQGIVNYFTTHR